MTDLLSALHRAYALGVTIVPGDLETVAWAADPRTRTVTVASGLDLPAWADAVVDAVAALLPEVSRPAVSAGATALALDSVVVPLRPRLRPVR